MFKLQIFMLQFELQIFLETLLSFKYFGMVRKQVHHPDFALKLIFLEIRDLIIQQVII